MRVKQTLPSLQTIEEGLRVEKETAKKIRRAMETCDNGYRRIYHAMQEIDSLLETYGVEYILSYGLSISSCINYYNTGETYQNTVLYIDNRKDYGPLSGFTIGNWGDYVERYPSIFGGE